MSERKWVLLVAGSNDWQHYQHQANVCCLYQIIKEHGIPEDQIVVMMYDDIDKNEANPYKGNITSVITSTQNVYPGVPKDYTGANVTPQNFLYVLQGDSRAKGKVIRSKSPDKIFVYMSGLGDKGSFLFPGQSLSATELLTAVNGMSTANKFSKMVMIMDSNYSATMFQNLPSSSNTYVVTSCDKNSKNEDINTDPDLDLSISDQFSSHLLKLIYKNNFEKATFKDLYKFLQILAKPTPCEFGSKAISDSYLGEFL